MDELRKQKKVEEIKNNEAHKSELQAKKKLQEINEKKRRMQLKNSNVVGIDFQSYDINGKIIELQGVGDIPNLVPKCKESLIVSQNAEDEIQAKKRAQPKVLAAKKRISILPPPLNFNIPDGPQYTENLKGVYDAFIPTTGVKFTEKGRNPKESKVTISQQIGQLSKTDFNSIINDPLARTQISYSFLPDISKFAKTITDPRTLKNVEHTSDLGHSISAVSIGDQVTQSNVNVSGDISQMLIPKENAMNHFRIQSGLPSLLPNSYVPSFRKVRKEIILSKAAQQNAIDIFNASLPEGNSTQTRLKLNPIVKGEKTAIKQLKQSLGFLKRLPRERANVTQKQPWMKLAPPPIGSSLGHGIISRSLNVAP